MTPRQSTAMTCPLLDGEGSPEHLRTVERWDRYTVAVSILAVDN